MPTFLKVKRVIYSMHSMRPVNTLQSKAWAGSPKNIVMLNAWEYENNKISEAQKLVKEGKMSPIYYHMKRCLMDKKLLASYTGFSRFRITRHFKPNIFKRLSDKKLDKYIYAFGLKKREDLFNIND